MPNVRTKEPPRLQAGEYVRYVVCFEREGNSWGAYVPDLPGCVAVGKSKEKVQTLIAEAIDFHIEGLHLAGEEVPKPTSKLPDHKTSDETSAFVETQFPL